MWWIQWWFQKRIQQWIQMNSSLKQCLLNSLLNLIFISDKMLKLSNPQSGRFKNACYANSITQVISSVPLICDYFRGRKYKVISDRYPVSDELSRLLSHQGQPTSTGQLREAVGVASKKSYFHDGTQQDALEFLMELITSSLHETTLAILWNIVNCEYCERKIDFPERIFTDS